MKRILIFIFIAVLSASALRAQESATQQQIDQLSGRMQDLFESQAVLGKRLDRIEKDISELRERVNVPPPANDGASREELRKLAKSVQELADKQSADKELILDNIKQLGKAMSAEPIAPSVKKKKTGTGKTGGQPDVKMDEPTLPGGPQVGHEYKVKSGDSLGLIVKAYRDSGVKVTTAQILKANPGLDADKLFVGKTIFIPDPAAK
jgi:LysM repeat protein/outer membrane murein-binding lipoprotein Lpp